MAARLSFDNAVFSQFAFYATVVIIKTLLMAGITTITRMHKKVFANQEDCKPFSNEKKPLTPNTNDSDVERTRRCHLNDLENVIPFVLAGLLYVLTDPPAAVAALHFRIFTASRLFHTFVYLWPLPQPCRAITFGAGLVITVSMLCNVLKFATF